MVTAVSSHCPLEASCVLVCWQTLHTAISCSTRYTGVVRRECEEKLRIHRSLITTLIWKEKKNIKLRNATSLENQGQLVGAGRTKRGKNRSASIFATFTASRQNQRPLGLRRWQNQKKYSWYRNYYSVRAHESDSRGIADWAEWYMQIATKSKSNHYG